MLEDLARKVVQFGDVRRDEYRFAWSKLESCASILDVGCGTGTFLKFAPERIQGIDLNVDNVAFCKAEGLNAALGDALDLQFAQNSFDAVHSSHVLQVFAPQQAVKFLQELIRVTRPGGLIVVATLTDFRRFFRHPENVRPYPPDSLFRLFHGQKGAQSPMFPGIPRVFVEDLWRRRPPLLEIEFPSVYALQRYCGTLNALQYGLFLRKWWTYSAYTVVFRKAA